MPVKDTGNHHPDTPISRVDQAPHAPPSALRQISWDVHLQQYLMKCAPSDTEKASRLTAAVHKQPVLPEPWWSLVQHADSQHDISSSQQSKRQGLALLQLYEWATKQVPRQGNYENEAFLKLWIGYAKQQWYQNGQDEGRDAFKSLKNQQIADKSALLYLQWAELEAKSGNISRAIKHLKTGIKESAQPVRPLEDMLSKLHSEAESSQIDSQLDADGTTATLQDATQQLRGHHLSGPVEGAAFVTPAGIKRPQHVQHGHSRLSSPRGKALPGHSSGATDTLVINPKAGLQSRHVGLATAVAAGNVTFHSNSSGSTISESECTTATLHSHPKATCANMTSRSFSSHGSSVSGEETQTLHDRTLGTAALGAEGTIQINQSLAHHSRPASSHVQQSFASAFRRDRSVGPKRTGLGGGAARVRAVPINAPVVLEPNTASAALVPEPATASEARPVVSTGSLRTAPAARLPSALHAPVAVSVSSGGAGPSAPSPEEEAKEGLQPDNSKKRKAESDAGQSHEMAAAVATAAGKRRASPEADADRTGRSEKLPKALQAAAMHAQKEATAEDDDEDDPETLPLLAKRVMAGRQSIVPGHSKVDDKSAYPSISQRPGPSGAFASHGATGVQQEAISSHPGPGPTSSTINRPASSMKPPMRRAPAPPPAPIPTPAPTPNPAQTQAPAAADNAALPGPSAGSSQQPAGSSQRAISVASGAAPMQQAAEAGSKADVPKKVVMGPPPAKPRQPLAPLPHQPASEQQPRHQHQQQQPLPTAQGRQHAQQLEWQPAAQKEQSQASVSQQQPQLQQQQQQQQQQRRRVREDENTVMVRGNRYTKLECVGRGGSSKVFKVMAPNRKIFALKRIKLQGKDSEASKGFVDEITLLQRLRGKQNIIQLIDAEVIQAEGTIYMVLEYGDIDLARLLAKHEQDRRESAGADALDENFIRLYWQQMLQAVQTIHEARIVHSDLKPANFLMVEGQLKLIDFGIAKAISSDTTSIARESQVGTLNYMSPEAILGGTNNIRGAPPMKVGRASDVWSLGCILYQMVYGHTPFSALAFIQKMHAITDPGYRIAFAPIKNAALADTIMRCLDRSPRTRIQMQELLEHPFLRPTESPMAPAPGQVGLNRDQLKKLLAQATEASASGADLDTLSEALFRQLSSGQTVNLSAIFKPTAQASKQASKGTVPSQAEATPAQQQQHLQRAAQAISVAAAAAAVNQGTTPAALLGTNDKSASGQLEGGPAASVSGLIRVASEAPGGASSAVLRIQQSNSSQHAESGLPSKADLERQAGRLRKVQPSQDSGKSSKPLDPLVAALQQGIAKMAVHSIVTDSTDSTETWQANVS